MTHTYNISGMTCTGCEAKVKKLLTAVKGVKQVDIDLTKHQATIQMEKHVPTTALQGALKDYPKYQLSEDGHMHMEMQSHAEENKTWLQTYKPVLLIFTYITVSTLLIGLKSGSDWMHWMNNFMGAFFLTFSFFKMLDLKGFAEGYSSYDIVAKRWFAYGYIYAFIELALGLAYITAFNPLLTNSITFVVMSISITGVLQSVLNKRKIKCACLGAVFNLPMSTITIIEDALMIIMSLVSILTMLSV
jgi:copper chaperone CopZ